MLPNLENQSQSLKCILIKAPIRMVKQVEVTNTNISLRTEGQLWEIIEYSYRYSQQDASCHFTSSKL
jgi:hypothetical protein